MITIASPQLGPEVEQLVVSVLRSGTIAQGPMVERFEALCADMAGTRHAVAMANGTVTLEAILEVSGIGPGDEVITSPLTFAATINAAIRAGATVRFADVGPDFTMDADATAALITGRTRALIPVHLYGLMADTDALEPLARRHDLVLVEDAAQAHGATIGEQHAGGVGIGSFSFYATKNITCGEGGVVTTSDDDLADQLRVLRNQGMKDRYSYLTVGRNLRMTDVQAAIGIPQLERLAEIIARRQHNAALLSAQLRDTDLSLVLPHVPTGRTHVWHQYTVLLPDTIDRDAVVDTMRSLGVAPGVYYPRLVWDYEAYRDHPRVVVADTPRAADIVRRCLSLPVHHGLDDSDIHRVADAIRGALLTVQ